MRSEKRSIGNGRLRGLSQNSSLARIRWRTLIIRRRGITVDIGLFSEGLASYLSGLIGETEENGKIFLQQEYRQPGPIDGEDFVQTVAAKYAEDMAGQPFGEEYRLWASGFTNPEERPFPEYPAIMYYLGYHAVKYLHEVENFTITSLLETPLTRMQEPVRRAVRELAQG